MPSSNQNTKWGKVHDCFSYNSVLIIVRLFLVISLTLLFSRTAGGEDIDHDYLSQLMERANVTKLADKRFWHLLLHYHPNKLSTGYTSEVDDPAFFLAPNGKFDPQAELNATLEFLFTNELVGNSHARCVYPARYHWLKSELSVDDGHLASQPCEDFERWLREIDPEGVTLVFASSYLNSAPSMFGHTFLRIDKKGQTEQTRLFATTVDYVADVTANNGLALLVLGATGGFKGYFSTLPYYVKVKTYNDIENRDIWEYRLSLTAQQITNMLMHVWELRNVYFSYFFIKENCSYNILSLVELASSELHLTDQFYLWAVPVDAIRLVMQQPGLVDEITYRPSSATQIRARRAEISEDDNRLLKTIIQHPNMTESQEFRSISIERQAFILDIASDYFQYRSWTDDSSTANRNNRHKLLMARANLEPTANRFRVTALTQQPDIGHRISRVGIGTGWRQNELFEEFNLRAGYHDLLDPGPGYPPGAQIGLLSFSIRHYEDSNRISIERFTLLNIMSLSPLDDLFKSPSWKIKAGVESVSLKGCRYCTHINLNGGVGVSAETQWLKHEIYFAFPEIDVSYGSVFENNHRIGGGASVGILVDLTEKWKVLASGSYLRYPLGESSEDIRTSLQQSLTLLKNVILRFELNHRSHDKEAVLVVHTYF